MRRSTILPFSILLAGILGLGSCSNPPGPVQPDVGTVPPGVLVFAPSIKPYLDVTGPQNYSYNALGLLEYNTQIRNKGSQAMTLSITTNCYDDKDRLTESQAPIRFFIDPDTIKPLQIAANSKESTKIQAQVAPAK